MRWAAIGLPFRHALKKGDTAMSAVEPVRIDPELLKKHPESWIELTQPGGLGKRMKEIGVTGQGFQLLHDHPQATAMLVEALDRDPEGVAAALSSFLSGLDARPKFGDHLLAKKGIKVIEGGQRGLTIPTDTPLMALNPVEFLRPGEKYIDGTTMRRRALDNKSPYFAPWGRDLLWRILNEQDVETQAFLVTLIRSLRRTLYYVFPGDGDLQDSDGRQCVLFMFNGDCGLDWSYGGLNEDDWGIQDRFLTLGKS